ncbi:MULTISPECIES: IS4 family transposase [Photorhabdus]|uniref:IS4 family transposase n=2 Tax=Photorhabdus TaxID=29487 RepID=A0A7C9GRJ9_9GAMM|nr:MULTISPECIES: IS4 family transposase [Photorhabdus]MQL49910.1 IS4 family transposase [Photorhabdus khanii]MQL50087.1 IS4 family transposase [Photorhabdus khanii]NHB98820.1 IS4 family transposase [Photorhabdus stackebrandtii]
MLLSQALETIHNYTPEEFSALSDLLSPEIIDECLVDTGVATVRKRRLPMEMMVWAITGMALFRSLSMNQIVSHLDILLPGKRPFVVPSAVVQARQRLGADVIKQVFEKTSRLWFEKTPLSHWNGLTLMALDGTLWRTPDTPENDAAFGRTANAHSSSEWPQLRMVCQMEVTSHLLAGAAFGSVSAISEVDLAARLANQTSEHTLTIMDKGFYALGLLHHWQSSGTEKHWMLPLRKGAQYKVVRKLGKNDELVELTLSPQARKKWANAPATLTARLLCKTIKNKIVYILTSMTDPQKYPKADIAELYGYRWEIEHGFREMKQHMLKNELTLRSKKPELIEQELWGVVLAYNLLRFMMTQMAYSQKGTEPYQIGFKQACLYLTGQLSLLPRVSPGKIPQFMSQLLDMSKSFVLPVRRERHYPRAVKKKPQRYPLRHS